jgi:hypothetical protein
MKRFLLILIIIGLIVWAGGYLFYRIYLPDIVANALVSDKTPTYIPKRLMNKVDELRMPVNKGADEMIVQMRRNNVALEDVLAVIDDTDEEEARNFLSELNTVKPTDANQVFDIAKKHITADFDIEVFRAPFVKNVSMKSIRKAMGYANTNQKTNDLDIETGRAIAKQILIQKYNEVNDTNKKSN